VSALEVGLAASGVVALACWALSVATREYSWVDRLWSIVPIGYVAWFAFASGLPSRACLLALLVLAWGVRLTFNFARKGGYAKGGEDYRWVELRARMSKPAFAAFNLAFIAGFQNALLFAITLPASHVSTQPLGSRDLALSALFVVLLIGETIADEQQWRFQNEKKARRARGETITHEFITTGLFRFSRHPNFFCEIAIWWTFAAFALDWTCLGALVLTALFQGSTRFTEELSLRKYPSYAAYQRTTSRLIPWFPARAASPDAP
jgi:steroid 5-alpha reductase family enzyme